MHDPPRFHLAGKRSAKDPARYYGVIGRLSILGGRSTSSLWERGRRATVSRAATMEPIDNVTRVVYVHSYTRRGRRQPGRAAANADGERSAPTLSAFGFAGGFFRARTSL